MRYKIQIIVFIVLSVSLVIVGILTQRNFTRNRTLAEQRKALEVKLNQREATASQIGQQERFEKWDANSILISFGNPEDGEVNIKIDPNGHLWIERVNCDPNQAAFVVWKCVDAHILSLGGLR